MKPINWMDQRKEKKLTNVEEEEFIQLDWKGSLYFWKIKYK